MNGFFTSAYNSLLIWYCCYFSADWKDVLLQHIDAHILPAHWGGTKTDPDGDPKCPSLVSLFFYDYMELLQEKVSKKYWNWTFIVWIWHEKCPWRTSDHKTTSLSPAISNVFVTLGKILSLNCIGDLSVTRYLLGAPSKGMNKCLGKGSWQLVTTALWSKLESAMLKNRHKM